MPRGLVPLPRSTAIAGRLPLLMALLFSFALAHAAEARGATVVTGSDNPEAALLIDPTIDPVDPYAGQTGDDVFFIQKLPASRTITRVTIGKLARHADCASESEIEAALTIREYPTGSYADPDYVEEQVAASVDRVTLTGEMRTVTFTFKPTRLVAGRGYLLRLTKTGGTCFGWSRTTWAHNQPTVNGGAVRCAGVHDGSRLRRLWHVEGQDDALPECVDVPPDTRNFDASLPTGWLAVRYSPFNQGYDAFLVGQSAETGTTCREQFPDYGLREVFWRGPDESGESYYACLFSQWAPPGEEPEDGWYYTPAPVYGRDSAPRDMYLKLEYNPDDDIRRMPDCSGLQYDLCEQRIRDAGFANVTRINLNGSDVAFSLPPDGVKQTDPTAGTLIAVNRDIVVYANPRRSIYRAQRFKPILRWDSSEDYRPLNVDEFFGELRHRVCHVPEEEMDAPCMAIGSAGSLSGFTHQGDYIHVQGLEEPPYGKDDDDYKTNRDCIGDGIYECDRGQYAGTYFHHVPTGAPGGYEVFDYWWFYRFNRVPDAANEVSIASGNGPLLHEGDWESISVGVRPDADIFDYVAFSQHGTWWGYLRDNVECDAGGAFSCTSNTLGGTWSGKRVHSYVANGTHANYPTTCPLRPPLQLCWQNNGLPETGHDGRDTWQGGDDPTTMFTELFDERSWVRWQGDWGAPGSLHEGFRDGPNSPGAPDTDNGLHYDTPWNRTCAPANPGCDPDLQAAPTQSASTSSLRSCDGWFGDAVAALACESNQLQTALHNATLGRDGDVRVRVATFARPASFAPRQASAPGLAQALAEPLQQGDEVAIQGHLDPDAVILIRLAGQPDPVEVRLDRAARERRSRTLRVVGRAVPRIELIGPGSLRAVTRPSSQAILRGPLLGPTLRAPSLDSPE